MRNSPSIPATIATDGRMPLSDIYAAMDGLLKHKDGWHRDLVHMLQVQGMVANSLVGALAVDCLRTDVKGKALWIIGGVHGEEPAGPMAIARRMSFFEELRREGLPIVLLPMLNPAGYFRDWRYPDGARWGDGGNSVTDCDHVLPTLSDPAKSVSAQPSSAAAGEIIAYVLKLIQDYPPHLVLDFHEDLWAEGDLHSNPYIFSQGEKGKEDPVAHAVVDILLEMGMKLQMTGRTCWDEEIDRGVVSAEDDRSVDDLLARGGYFKNDVWTAKPSAKSVIVVETAVLEHSLEERVAAQEAVIANVRRLWELVG